MKLGRLQWAFIALAVIAIVVLAPADNGDDKSLARPEKHRAPDSSATDMSRHEVGHVELERLTNRDKQLKGKTKVSDVFNITPWYVPPPPPVFIAPPPPPPPPPPTAPPQPFTYLGRYGDTASRIIILAKSDHVYTVTVGDVIENTYRVEKFTPGMVNLTYLPLNIEQSLPTGDNL
jgi:hypothetical protein